MWGLVWLRESSTHKHSSTCLPSSSGQNPQGKCHIHQKQASFGVLDTCARSIPQKQTFPCSALSSEDTLWQGTEENPSLPDVFYFLLSTKWGFLIIIKTRKTPVSKAFWQDQNSSIFLLSFAKNQIFLFLFGQLLWTPLVIGCCFLHAAQSCWRSHPKGSVTSKNQIF